MTARSSFRKFGWCVDLVSDNAPEESEFRVAAESMVGHTGRLVTDHEIDSEGRGTSFRAGDLLFSKLRPYLAKSWVANRDGEALGDIHVYRPVDEMCSRYLGYLVLSSFFLEQVNASTYGTKMPRANWDFIKTIEVWAPDFDTQRRIADYLDRETATIDALIEKQLALVKRLRERRTAAIESVLTEFGTVTPVKRCAEMLPGFAFSSADFVVGGDGPMLLRGINVKPDRVDWAEAVSLSPGADAPPATYALQPGDLVLGMDRPFIGGGTRVALIEDESEGALLVQRVLRLRPTGGVDGRMLLYALGGTSFRTQIETEFTGISVPHLSESQVGRVKVPMPPVERQRRVADHLDRETAKIDALIAKAERFIELAQERRAALITAAVTGQIEIPT